MSITMFLVYATVCILAQLTAVQGTTMVWNYLPTQQPNSMTIVKPGVYLVSMRLVPKPGKEATYVSVGVVGKNDELFRAHDNGVTQGTDMAVYFKEGDNVTKTGTSSSSTTLLALLVDDTITSAYSSYMTNNSHYTPTQQYLRPVGWRRDVIAFQLWRGTGGWGHDKRLFHQVFVAGIYWATARTHPLHDTRETGKIVCNRRVLLEVAAWKNKSVSASAAFYLEKYSVVYLQANIQYEKGTIFSIALLYYNRKPATGEAKHIAWTGQVSKTMWVQAPASLQRVEFGRILTDYGAMYRAQYSTIIIPKSGAYLVSLRTDPACDKEETRSTSLKVYKMNRVYWQAFTEHCLPSGQTEVFNLDFSETLHVAPDHHGGYVGTFTVFSVAFVQFW